MAPRKKTQNEMAECTALLDLVKWVFEKQGKRQGPSSKALRQSPGVRIIKTPVKDTEPLASQLFDLFDQLFGKRSQRRHLTRQSRRQAPSAKGSSPKTR
jgi:hypothetical protein